MPRILTIATWAISAVWLTVLAVGAIAQRL